MTTLKCKKTTILAGVSYYIEGKRYFISKEDSSFYYVIDEKGNENFISKTLSHIHLNFDDIFYNNYELRRLKIEKIINEKDIRIK